MRGNGPCIALVVGWLCAATSPGFAQVRATSARGESIAVSTRADEQLASGGHERAARLYRRAIDIDETNLRAYVGLSSALARGGRGDESLAVLDRAESVVGWSPELGLARGIQLTRLARWDDAVSSLRRVLADEPDAFEASYHLAGAYLARKNWRDAVVAYDRYLAHRPSHAAARDDTVRVRRAFARLQLRKYEQARRDLVAVLKRKPGSRPARLLLLSALARLGRCREALDVFGQIEELKATSPTMLYDAALCRFRLGDGKAALATLDDYRARSKLPRQALLLAARIHASLGETALAIERYEAAIAAGSAAHVEFARWLTKIGDHARVATTLWPVVEQSHDPALLRLAASALLAVSDVDRASIASARLVGLRRDVASWLLHGRIQLERKDWGEAERAFSRALDIRPRHKQAAAGLRRALAHRATAAFRAGDRELAHRLLERAHRADPADSDVAYNLGLLELARGNPERAVALVADRLPGLSKPHRGRLLLARAHIDAGDPRAARSQLEIVADSADADPADRSKALLELAHVTTAAAPDQALASIDRARKLIGRQGTATAQLTTALDAAEAGARLALAERALDSRQVTALRQAVDRLRIDQLPPQARARAKVLALFARAHSTGLSSALRALDAIPEDDLALVAAESLPPATLRHALALHLGQRLLRRPADYERQLRGHADALAGATEPAVSALVRAWYDHMLWWSLARPAPKLAVALARSAPIKAQSPSFQHNAVLATAGKSLTAAQVTSLDRLAPSVPEAALNLAIDAERRGDHAAALVRLRQIPAQARAPTIPEWLRWKEIFHGK